MKRPVAVFVMLVSVLVVWTPAAGAHTEIDESVPAASTTVGGDVGRMELFFVGPFDEDAPVTVTVTGNSGERTADVEVVDEFTLIATFEPLDVPGIHIATWEVIAVDGDLSTGEILFEFEPSRDAPDYLLLDRERSFAVFVIVAIVAIVAAAVVIPVGRRVRRTAITGHTIEIVHAPGAENAGDVAEAVHVALTELGHDVEISMVERGDGAAGSDGDGQTTVLLDGEHLVDAGTDVDDDAITSALARRLGD